MGELILQNSKVYVDGYDISGDLNQVSITQTADILDKTVLGCSGRKRRGGLKSHEIRIGGFWNATTGLAFDNSSDAVDPVLWKDVGSTNSVLSVTEGSSVIGTTKVNKAWISQNINGEYSPSGTVGEMLSFGAGYMGDGALIRGYLFHCSSALSTGATITIKKMGFRGPNQGLYIAAHVMDFSSNGADLDLIVEQDNTTDFTGTPSTAITINLTSAYVGSARWTSTKLGSTADHSFRISLKADAASTTPTFKAAVFLGIK